MLSWGKSAMECFCDSHRSIVVSRYCITTNFIKMCYRRVAQSHYRKVADRNIVLSQDRRSLQSLNGYVFFHATLRYAISHIGYRRFFKVFQCECFLMHAMRWIRVAFLQFIIFTHKEMPYQSLRDAMFS